jgi:hypothetical protein
MAQFQEFTDTDVHLRQVSQTAHSRDIPSSYADKSVKITHPRRGVVPWQVCKLRPHPSYARLDIKVPASRLNALLEMGEDCAVLELLRVALRLGVLTTDTGAEEMEAMLVKQERWWSVNIKSLGRGVSIR